LFGGGQAGASNHRKEPSAAPSKLRNTLPALASNDLFGVAPRKEDIDIQYGKSFSKAIASSTR
jgi:hypothetical protein